MKYFRSKIYNSIYLEIEADDKESASRRAMAIYDSGALETFFSMMHWPLMTIWSYLMIFQISLRGMCSAMNSIIRC